MTKKKAQSRNIKLLTKAKVSIKNKRPRKKTKTNKPLRVRKGKKRLSRKRGGKSRKQYGGMNDAGREGDAEITGIGYDFDGVLHRTMSSYNKDGQGHPKFYLKKDGSAMLEEKDDHDHTPHPRKTQTALAVDKENRFGYADSFTPNLNIINEIKKQMEDGIKVHIISRSPIDKKGFLAKHFPKKHGEIEVHQAPTHKKGRDYSKAEYIKEHVLNIQVFYEDSVNELITIRKFNPDLKLYLVNTAEIYTNYASSGNVIGRDQPDPPTEPEKKGWQPRDRDLCYSPPTEHADAETFGFPDGVQTVDEDEGPFGFSS